tara:strand:+ start:79 stop:471 length:393 start_codon:yes stop_codon:yes gene_type:complete
MRLADKMLEDLNAGLSRYAILDSPNPVAPQTPQDTPLSVVAWGINKSGIHYDNVDGWDNLSDDDEWIILDDGNKCYAAPRNIPHTRLIKPSLRTMESLVELVEHTLQEAGACFDPAVLWSDPDSDDEDEW